MDGFNFSEAFLDAAFKALMWNECKTDEEKAFFNVLCEVCTRYHISVKDFMQASTELEQRIKELHND